jgi:CRISPR-associated protein Cmr4
LDLIDIKGAKMELYDNKIYLIENVTNLHVGSGDTNFGTVDNTVQRDVLTNYPIIHSSSLKGAIREFFEFYNFKDNNFTDEYKKNFIKHIFGDEDKNPGNIVFNEAFMLGMPFRSRDYPYVFCLSDMSIKMFLDLLNDFNINHKIKDALKDYVSLNEIKSNVSTIIEDIEVNENDSLEKLKEFLNEDYIAVLPHKDFKKLLMDLPVVARNKLNNGKSENLFYEEFVPRKSKFFTVISFPVLERVSNDERFEDKEKIKDFYEKFQDMITSEVNLVQIGANASIGYGLCKFKEVK